MNISFVRIFLLIAMWWICSSVAEPFFLVAGGISVWITWAIVARMKLWSKQSLLLQPLQLATYLGWLIKEIALAAHNVARILWQVKPRITPRLFTVESKLKDELALTLYGNSITLTPGTACVEIDGRKVQVHALEKASVADIQSAQMEKQVAKVIA